MRRQRIHKDIILITITLAAIILFAVLNFDFGRRTESVGLTEDKDIYKHDNNIYDVYISVFPTEDDTGEMIDLSSFSLHTSGNRDYNPILDCNVQILNEGEMPNSKIDIDCKNATIRVRGNSTRGAEYKSYKVKLEHNSDSFFGQTNLNINKHFYDVTKIATKLQTDLLADIDNMFSYRTYFMRVWIRDASLPEEEQEFQFQGLYTEIEQPDEEYLKVRGLGKSTVMYKANNFAFNYSDVLRDVDDPMYNKDEFETVLGIQSGSNHKKLLKMLDAVNDFSLDFEEVFQTYFDEDNYLTWLAFNLLMGNEDTKNQNYIFFSPEHTEKWYFIPWDFDGALYFNQYVDTQQYQLLLKSIQGFNVSVLHRRYLQMEGSIGKLQEKMKELLDKSITEEKVTELVNSYKGVLERTLSILPDSRWQQIPLDELMIYFDNLHEGMVKCYELYENNIVYPAPMFVARPQKQEDGSLEFAWDSSYSYQGLPITYKIEVLNATMDETVLEQEGIEDNVWILREGLEPATYFLRVSVVDSDGHEQINLERFIGQLADGRAVDVYGLLDFVIE